MTDIIVQIDETCLLKGVHVMSKPLYVFVVVFAGNYVCYVLFAEIRSFIYVVFPLSIHLCVWCVQIEKIISCAMGNNMVRRFFVVFGVAEVATASFVTFICLKRFGTDVSLRLCGTSRDQSSGL